MGVPGEMYIGGAGVAREYLNRPELTAEKFIQNPLIGRADLPVCLPGRLYKTGDLARWRADGNLEFLGRIDHQVKIRGFRIELGEIESVLRKHPALRESVVIVREDRPGDKRLAAYIVRKPEAQVSADELRRFAREALPEYMVPPAFVFLDALPLTPNGKVDRKALPDVSRPPSAHPPHDGLERRIADVWEEVLHLRHIGRDESFFHLGGNSLLAVRMQAELRKRLDLTISIADLYAAPTIEAVAAGRTGRFIDAALADAARPVDAATGAEPVRPPRVALLTGASGFLGIFLLHELCSRLDKVYCLLRTPDAEPIRHKAKVAGLDVDMSKVHVVAGDLEQVKLGLGPDVWQRLGEDVDLIVHCGAFVHHLHSYDAMRAANVESTRTLLSLATQHRLKRFCFVSTLPVAFAVEGVEQAAEAVLPNRPLVDKGYLLTKWVGEQQVALAARQGIPVVVARPGNITGSRRTGYTNFANNHFWLFNKGCLQLGAYPDLAAPVEMMPVDLLAQAIAALAVTHDAGLRVANLDNPKTMSRRDLFDYLAHAGFKARRLPPPEWQRLLPDLPVDNALAKIKDLYTGDLSGTPPPIERRATLEALSASNVSLDVDYAALLPIYIDYLRQAGFLT
jgi:thioester reductase-like protein